MAESFVGLFESKGILKKEYFFLLPALYSVFLYKFAGEKDMYSKFYNKTYYGILNK